MQLNSFFRTTTSETGRVNAQEAAYLSWRRASDVVLESYRAWATAGRGERGLAYAAYQAALDREEDAARTYRELVEQR